MRFRQPNLPSGAQYASFEFAPASGAGMGAACACTTPTGAKGDVLSVSRASNATCSKQGLATTGISNGDLVVCGSNAIRVETDVGGSGLLAVLGEGARTNSVLWSEALGNAAWSKVGSTAPFAPTVTADQAVAPDGATTAERVQYPATSAADFGGVRTATAVLTAAPWAASVYLKGNGTSGTLDICMQAGVYVCTACNYVSTSWTRCTAAGTPSAAGQLYVGNMSSVNGGTARGAADVFVWGIQAELGAFASSYIPTTTAAVIRQADVLTGALPSAPGATGSAAFTFTPEWSGTAGGGPMVYFGGNARALYGTGGFARSYDGSLNPAVSMGATANTAKRYWSSWSTANGWVVRNATDATQATSAFTVGTWSTTTTITILSPSVSDAYGLVSALCYDSSESRCR